MTDAAYVRTINGQQRKFLKIDGHEYPAEEVAWLYVTGEWPKHRIIFKDGNPLNLKWDNLIDAA